MEFDAENLEQVTPDFVRYWLDDNKIVVYQPANTNRSTVDTWVNMVKQTAQAWADDTLYLELHDMRNASITPYSRSKAGELIKFLHGYEGRAAIVLAETRTGEIMGYFVNTVFSRMNQTMKRRIFTSIDEALEWLRQAYD